MINLSNGINIFISHAGEDESDMNKFKKLIERHYSSVRDSSIYESGDKNNNAKNEDYIKSLIRPQVDWAGTFIVLVGKTTAASDWVNWEIEYAQKKDKNIIGVFLPGSTEADLPTALQEYANSIVDWDADSILRAIEGGRLFKDPNGNERSYNDGYRGTC